MIKGTKYIGLANIVWQRCGGTGDKPPMDELLQEAFTPEAVAARLNAWLEDDEARKAVEKRLDETVRKLDTEEDPLALIVKELV